MRALGEPLTAEESAALIAACRSFMGVRFRHQGRNPEIGLDCAGMLGAGLRKIGRTFLDVKGYGREPHKNGLRAALVSNLGPPIAMADMRPGDVPLMRFDGEPRHVGVLTDLGGRLGLIHVHSENKRVQEHGIGHAGDRWFDCIVEIWRP